MLYAKRGDVCTYEHLYSDNYVEPLQPLLQEQFDPKAFAAHTVQCQMVGEVLYKLTSGIAELDRELYTQVRHFTFYLYVHVRS